MNRITLITLAVENVARARQFYGKLGWVASGEDEDSDDIVFYDLKNGLKLGFYRVSKLAEDLGCPVETLGTGTSTLAVNFSTEGEVDTAYERAVSAGAERIHAPKKVFWGGYSGLWRDPFGHIWEYAVNPFWTLDRDGLLRAPTA